MLYAYYLSCYVVSTNFKRYSVIEVSTLFPPIIQAFSLLLIRIHMTISVQKLCKTMASNIRASYTYILSLLCNPYLVCILFGINPYIFLS